MGPILGSATVVGRVVYISSLRPPRTVGLDVDTGRVVWRFRDGQFSPLVADGYATWLAGRNRFYRLHPLRRPRGAPPPPTHRRRPPRAP